MAVHTKARPAITVRALEVEDLPTVQEIDRKSSGRFRSYTYEDQHCHCLGGDLSLSYVAEVNGEVVGFVCGWLSDVFWAYRQVARLEMVGVDPSHRRQGIGRRLLSAFFEGARAKGIRDVQISVERQDRELKTFLCKLGFRQGSVQQYGLDIGG